VSTIADAQQVFRMLFDDSTSTATLLFFHLEKQPTLSHSGLPIVISTPFHQQVNNQMNNHWDFATVADYLQKVPPYTHVFNGNIINCVTKVMKLTPGKLIQQEDWEEWQNSE
jgi:hypothetical protein